MMKLSFHFFLGMSLFLCMQSCESSKKTAVSDDKKQTAPTTKTATITRSNNGETVSVRLGDKFDVLLNECRGCADMWQLSQSGKKIVALQSATYSNVSCTDCVGGTQDKTFHFETLSKGTTELNFKYFDAKFSVTISVY